MNKRVILLVRKIVPNYWEIKNVDGPSLRAKEWTPVAFSQDMSLTELSMKVPECTVLDVTNHFTGATGA